MREVLGKILDVAKQNLYRDGHLLPVAFLFKGQSLEKMIPMVMEIPGGGSDADNKTYNVFCAGAFAAQYGADYVALLWDGAIRTATELPKDETELPLTYPRSMRTEVIMLIGIPLPEGEEVFMAAPYKGGEGEPVKFLEDAAPKGVVKIRFTEVVRKGYKTASNIKG